MKEELVATLFSLIFGFTISIGLETAPTTRAVYFFLAFWIAGTTYLQVMQTSYLARLTRQ